MPRQIATDSHQKLHDDLLRALQADFAQHGEAAIAEMREEDPSGYVRAIVSLMPKDLDLKQPLGEMTEDELIAGIAVLQRFLAAQNDVPGAGEAPRAEQAPGLPAL